MKDYLKPTVNKPTKLPPPPPSAKVNPVMLKATIQVAQGLIKWWEEYEKPNLSQEEIDSYILGEPSEVAIARLLLSVQKDVYIVMEHNNVEKTQYRIGPVFVNKKSAKAFIETFGHQCGFLSWSIENTKLDFS